MKIRKLLSIVFLASILSGCISIDHNVSTDTIVSKYSSIYINISMIDTNTDNHDIAAMLQTITVDLIKKPSNSWKEVTIREQRYIDDIKTNNISPVYTIRACSNEIDIVDGFCDEIIYYYSVVEPNYAYFSGNFLGESATRFIIKMDNYEYEKVKTNR